MASSQVVMKIDIEGTELEVVPDLLISGALRSVNKIFIEWHQRLQTDRRRKDLMTKVCIFIKMNKIITAENIGKRYKCTYIISSRITFRLSCSPL